MKKCIACGMPMENKEDFAMGNTEKAYCHYCSRADGSMQSYDEKLQSLRAFIMKTQGIGEIEASVKAKNMMSQLPAWQSDNN